MKNDYATATPQATVALITGLTITLFFTTADTASELSKKYAVAVGISLLVSAMIDYRRDLRNLVRADLMALGSLYFLTLLEFLLPQSNFDALLTTQDVEPALKACVFGFLGLAIGRHFRPPVPKSLTAILRNEIPPRTLLKLYTFCFIGGYLYMLLAVNFDVGEMLHQFMAPRFSQSWTRGRLGDWKAQFGEFGMIIYLVPPLAGIVFAKRREFSWNQKIYIGATFLFTLFYGYTSGTRNIFATYLATFLVAYSFVIERQRKRELILVACVVGAMMLSATVTMLQFRNIGFERYWAGDREATKEKQEAAFFVDYNLYVIAKLITVFPERHEYLGFEIPYLSVIRPIPRAIWRGKPEGLSVSIENAVGVEGLTLASSFVGEAYMSGGMLGIFVTGLVFGSINGWWGQLGRRENSSLGHLIFASGFFASVISMRSMFVFTTAMLPTILILLVGNWLLGRRAQRRAASSHG